MKRMGTFGLCLLAASVICVAASATASAALPEFVPVQSGQKIKSSSGASKLETPGLPPIECKSAKSVAKLEGTKEFKALKITYKTCSAEGGAKVCESGTKEGQIKTNAIKGHVDYLGGKGTGTPTVGVLFEPEKAGTLFAKFTCGSGAGAITVEVLGSVIAEQTPVNVSSTKSKIFARNGGSGESKQQYEHFEGEGTKHHLESFFNSAGPFPSNQQQEASNTTETPVELKA